MYFTFCLEVGRFNLLELYIRNADIHHHHTRHIDDIHLPNVHFDITRRSFVYKSPLERLQLSDKLKMPNLNLHLSSISVNVCCIVIKLSNQIKLE